MERLYPAQAQRPTESFQGINNQASAMAGIIQRHCTNGVSIARMHDDAAIKLDSAEYAICSMLDELKGAMTALPTSWTPERTWSQANANIPAYQEAKAA